MFAPVWHQCRLVSSTCMSYKSWRETNLSSVLNLGGCANFVRQYYTFLLQFLEGLGLLSVLRFLVRPVV